LTVLQDRERRGEDSGSVEEIAHGTAWPGERTYGIERTRRVLHELRNLGLVRRVYSRGDCVRWEAQR